MVYNKKDRNFNLALNPVKTHSVLFDVPTFITRVKLFILGVAKKFTKAISPYFRKRKKWGDSLK